jgi:hypothetical protein
MDQQWNCPKSFSEVSLCEFEQKQRRRLYNAWKSPSMLLYGADFPLVSVAKNQND